MVSISWVVPESEDRIIGVLYGASGTTALNTNRIYAAWLQRRILFKSADNRTVWGIGSASRAIGPSTVGGDLGEQSAATRAFLFCTTQTISRRMILVGHCYLFQTWLRSMKEMCGP